MLIKDLDFITHPLGRGCEVAEHTFDNGYGVSVITGPLFYTSPGKPYEIAILHGDSIAYDTPIAGDVIGHLSESAANEILAAVEALPNK